MVTGLHIGYTEILRGVTSETRIVTGFAGFGYTVTLKSLILECLGIFIIILIYILIIYLYKILNI